MKRDPVSEALREFIKTRDQVDSSCPDTKRVRDMLLELKRQGVYLPDDSSDFVRLH